MAPEVSTSYGRLRGSIEDGLSVFKGIPFAAAPAGDLRFRAPQPPAKWEGVRDATAFGASCPQPAPMPAANSVFAGMFSAAAAETGEDCLNLNVWTPGLDGARRPVMVWIHGGGYRTGNGSSPMYSGAGLAKRGNVVVVTINYRLGALGFLHLPELGGSNFGLLDQVAALRWVKDEIAAFGGDPANVTVFGESAGGKSVETVMATPKSRGLFSRAILESTYDPAMDEAGSISLAEQLLAKLGIGRNEPDKLRALSARQVVDAQVAAAEEQMRVGGGMAGGGLGGRGFGPTVDGDVLPKHPLQAALDGDFKDIPAIIGTNLDETKLFGAMMPGARDIDDAGLLRRVTAQVGDEGRARAAIEAYAVLGACEASPPRPPTSRRQSRRTACSAPTRSSWPRTTAATSPRPTSTSSPGRRRCSRAPSAPAMRWSLPFVFGTFDAGLGQLAGDGPEARELSGKMQDAWLAFARTGDPATKSLPAWYRYEPGKRLTMVLDRKCELVSAPQEPERAFWD